MFKNKKSKSTIEKKVAVGMICGVIGLLTVAVQVLISEVEELQDRVEALEARKECGCQRRQPPEEQE